jgi:hypothetical protein
MRWDFIKGNAPSGDQLYGFTVAVNDRDNEVRQNQVFWKYTPAHWQDTSLFGDLKLLPASGGTTTVAAPTNLNITH